MSTAREACQAARALALRLAAAAALVVALLSLIQQAPLWLACLRGAATLVLLTLCARGGAAALERAVAADQRRSGAPGGSDAGRSER